MKNTKRSVSSTGLTVAKVSSYSLIGHIIRQCNPCNPGPTMQFRPAESMIAINILMKIEMSGNSCLRLGFDQRWPWSLNSKIRELVTSPRVGADLGSKR